MSSGDTRKILVTGSSGFVGSWVSRILVQRGYAVRALYRRDQIPDHLRKTEELGAELQRRDLTCLEDVRAAVQEVEGVIHCAGLVKDWGYEQEFYAQNVEVTKRLVDEARRSGCGVFVFLSSLSVHGFGVHRGSTEEGPFYPYVSGYQSSKKAAEEYVLSQAAPGFRVTVLRSGNAYGPGDTTTFYRLFAILERGVRGTVSGSRVLTSPVYIEDLVEAIELALENDASAGEVFNICSGEEVTWGEMMQYCAELLGVRPWFELPIGLAWVAAYLFNSIYRLFRIKAEPPVFPYRVAHIAWDYNFSIEKARRILGYQPKTDWRTGLSRTVAAYKDFEKEQ
ncbi:MAG: NAD-dependent epimerase/dehydratase family protein [Spirochaetaceae bacterium]|nr:MAG: NAD-dependent epimerase/dehydratase family protein [Spirochaetaceae bacterium]